jgi:hypothetical protein
MKIPKSGALIIFLNNSGKELNLLPLLGIIHMSTIVNRLLAHKYIVIGAIALAGLLVYALPIGDIFSQVSAAQGGGDQSAAGGHPTNPNAYKVCEHNSTPKKCYGHTSGG